MLPSTTSRRRRVLRSCLFIAAGLTFAFISLIVFVLIQLTGGFPWAFTHPPKATDREVVAANSAGEAQRDILVSTLQIAGASAGPAPVAKTSPVPSCREGQHNWKINSEYDLVCDTNLSIVLGSARGTETALKKQLLTFHDQLVAHKWQSSHPRTTTTSIKDIVNQPYAPGTTGPQPLLRQLRRGRDAVYFKGERGGQGSATISLRLTADPDDYIVRLLAHVPPGTTSPDGSPKASRDTRLFLSTANSYIVSMSVTYVSYLR